MERRDNYETWRRDWRARFLSQDQAALLEKLPFLRAAEETITVPYFIWAVSLDRTTGVMTAPIRLELYDEMNIYTRLWYSQPGAVAAGERVPFAQLRHAAPYAPAFQRGNLESLAAAFSGRGKALEKALRALGGRPISGGDVAYEIRVFPDFPVQLRFWDGDDEFPAQVNLLFDRNCTDLIHVESVVTIASQTQRHLERLAAASEAALAD